MSHFTDRVLFSWHPKSFNVSTLLFITRFFLRFKVQTWTKIPTCWTLLCKQRLGWSKSLANCRILPTETFYQSWVFFFRGTQRASMYQHCCLLFDFSLGSKFKPEPKFKIVNNQIVKPHVVTNSSNNQIESKHPSMEYSYNP